MKKTGCSAIALFLFSTLGYSNIAAASSGSMSIYPPETKPYGKSYEEHVIDFWKWVLAIPKDSSPWDDQTGKNCLSGQSASNSSIFYLSSNGGGESDRTCKLPAGKSLFIPISPMEISDKEAPNSSVEDLRRIAKDDQDSVTVLSLQIDGKEYSREELNRFRIDTRDFVVTFPKNAIFGVSEGPSVAVADGYYVITEPIEVGNHTITYKSALPLPESSPPKLFAQDITYEVIAE